jgi:hypothetical protein
MAEVDENGPCTLAGSWIPFLLLEDGGDEPLEIGDSICSIQALNQFPDRGRLMPGDQVHLHMVG